MTAPEPTDDTYMAVSIGELKTGMANVLAGIESINTKLDNQDGRLRTVETKHEVLETRVNTIDNTMVSKEEHKAPWTAIVAILVAAGSFALQFIQH